MPSTVLITGSSTGIGNLTARALAAAGHTVYASMRDVRGKNAGHAGDLARFADAHGLTIRSVELDVQLQASADAAVGTVLDEAGRLDAVVHNAGHLAVGYAEAFTADDVAHLFDVNVLGIQRVNRAALPHMRARRAGVLLYVGSTSTVCVPPFLAPYVATKAAGDALAAATAYEVGQFGIDTSIVMPGAFTSGTEHFPNASRPSDRAVTAAYAALDSLLARNEEATAGLFAPGVDADPRAVADEVVRVLALPAGERPFRSVVDFTGADVARVNAVLLAAQTDFLTRMGFAALLRPAAAAGAAR